MTVRRSGANSARQMDRVLIYDGECRFCIGQAATVARLLRPCALESFREPGVLERYPGITEEACGQAVQLVLKSEGRVLNGAAAVAYALRRVGQALGIVLHRLDDFVRRPHRVREERIVDERCGITVTPCQRSSESPPLGSFETPPLG
jgi:predicted DCC family thiol-disulfide oxidoreductase YuxK